MCLLRKIEKMLFGIFFQITKRNNAQPNSWGGTQRNPANSDHCTDPEAIKPVFSSCVVEFRSGLRSRRVRKRVKTKFGTSKRQSVRGRHYGHRTTSRPLAPVSVSAWTSFARIYLLSFTLQEDVTAFLITRCVTRRTFLLF